MARKKELPHGLLEFEGSLYEAKYALELLPRLTELKGSDFGAEIAAHKEACIAAERAAEHARQCRSRATEIAESIFKKAVKGWTVKQLQKATGYTDE